MMQEIIDVYQQTLARPEVIYKKLNKKYTINQIKHVLKNIDTNQIIGKKQENKELEIPISAPAGSFQADITFYDQYKKQNNGFSAILTIIEINTRYAYVFPLKDKKAESILKCLEILNSKEKSNLKSISFDSGSEFDNKIVKSYLDRNNIKYIFFNKQTHPNSTMIIERFNRTLRDKISKYQNFKKQKNYIDKLQKIVDEYNKTEHMSIGMTPLQAKQNHFSNHEARQQKLDIIDKIDQQFKIGDIVRVFRDKKLFEKGQKNYTKNIYKIIGKEDNNFILQKFVDGQLKDKVIKKTAQYLMKVNVLELIQNQKKKKEVSKKEVQKQTNLEKKLKREGINLENIMQYEKFLEDNNIPIIQQNEKKPIIDKFIIAEQIARENKIRDIKNQNDKLEVQNKLQRTRSMEDLQKNKQQLNQQDEELIKKEEQLHKTQIEKQVKQNEAIIKDYQLKIKDNNIDVFNAKIKERQDLFQQMKTNYRIDDIIRYYKQNENRDFFKQIKDGLSKQNDNIQKIEQFMKNKSIDDNEFKKPKNSSKNSVSEYTYYLHIFQRICQIYYQQQVEELQKENQKLQEVESEEEINEQKDKKQQQERQLEKEAEQLQNEIMEIKDKINILKAQRQQAPDDEDVINQEINELVKQKGMLKQQYQELTGKKYLEHKEEKERKQNSSSGGDDDQPGNLFKMFNNFGKK